MTVRPINLALLVKSTSIPEWQYLMLQRLLILRGVRLRLVINDKSRSEGTALLLSQGLRVVRAVDRFWFRLKSNPTQCRSLKSLYNLGQVRSLGEQNLELTFREQAIDIDSEKRPSLCHSIQAMRPFFSLSIHSSKKTK